MSDHTEKTHKTEHLVQGRFFPLLQIRVANEFEAPSEVEWDEKSGMVSFTFPKNGATLKVESEKKDGYVAFELMEEIGNLLIDLIVWGPYATEITQTIGECVGVVRDSLFALGI